METTETGFALTGTRFRVKDFEGPLDVLLFLIKKNEINIYDIPVAQITEQYLSFLKDEAGFNLDEAADFQSLAAALLYIKSRMLLPMEFHLKDEAEDPRQGLVERLIEYQRFKKLSELMEAKGRDAEWVVERKKIQRLLPFGDDEFIEQPDVRDLLKTFSSLMSTLSEERIIDLYEEVSVNEKITLIAEYLETRGECTFRDLLLRKGSLGELVCAFLAVLEAVKISMIRIAQAQEFGDIRILPKSPEPEQADA